MIPWPALVDCCEIRMRPAMCWPWTTLPVTVISVDGYLKTRGAVELRVSGSGVAGSKRSAQVQVEAGICIIRLQGTVMFSPLTSAVPPKRCGSVTPGQAALLTVASWMNPVTSNPCVKSGLPVKVTGPIAGGGGTTTCGGLGGAPAGLAVPPPAA